MAECFHVAGGRLILSVKAVPGASKNGFAGVKDDKLRVRVAAAPEDGKANAELAAFLAKSLGCTKKEIILQLGEKSRNKTLSLPLSVLHILESVVRGLA